MKEQLKVFTISSSLIVFAITITYIGIAYRKAGRPIDIPFELFALFIPLSFGIFGIINYYVIKKYNKNYSLLVGLSLGILFSIMGRFGMNLPQRIFGHTKENEFMVHIYASIIYPLIFRFILTPLQLYLI